MSLIIREIEAKSILSRTGIPGVDYCLNPYTGCAHACRYCYATFMKKYTGHTEIWGSFVDAKVNAPGLLHKQLRTAPKGEVMISSVTDPYQPLEARFKITRRCLEILRTHRFPVRVLTKSPLVLRDTDLFREYEDIEVGVTVTTDRDDIRKIFEPGAPSISARIKALRALDEAGIPTYAFIGPLLPMDPEALAASLAPWAGRVLVDDMNYLSKTRHVYRDLGLDRWLDPGFLEDIHTRLVASFPPGTLTRC